MLNDKNQEPLLLQVAAVALRPTLDLVIDTNVVLDWLAFRHPVGAQLEEALTSGQCRWLCTRAMRDELAHVVARESLERWAIDADAVLAVFDALGVDAGTPPPLCAAERLRCSDPDDQHFVDLAITQRVHALLTRDRAVLRLASRARPFGVLIATPEVWLHRRLNEDRMSSGPGRDGSIPRAPGSG
ncbi:MAG: PIN domain-containing protein [Caldimonas sp.]